MLEDAFEQIGRRGFAAGARHANHAQLFCRMAIKGRGDQRHGRSIIFDDNLRHGQILLLRDDQADRACLIGIFGILMAIALIAFDAEKQISLLDFPGIIGNPLDLYLLFSKNLAFYSCQKIS